MLREKDLDSLLDGEIRANASFRAWFLSKTKYGRDFRSCVYSNAKNPWCAVRLLLPNAETGALEMVTRQGETDVLVVFEDDTKKRLGVHIENKLAAGSFTAYQPEVCAARAEHWVKPPDYGNYDVWETILVAPERFRERNQQQARKYMTYISHEDISLWIPEFGGVPTTPPKLKGGG